jgi:hypothetical protein
MEFLLLPRYVVSGVGRINIEICGVSGKLESAIGITVIKYYIAGANY